MFVAGVAHPVERHLAKVEVASSSLVTRSKKPHCKRCGFLIFGYFEALTMDRILKKFSRPVQSWTDLLCFFLDGYCQLPV